MPHDRFRTATAFLALTALVIGGGTAAGDATTESPYGLADRPAPAVTGAELVDMLTDFVTEFPYRITGTPHELLAQQALVEDARSLGYVADVRHLSANAAVPVGTPPVSVVTAFREGTTLADEVILFVGHYDTLPTSLQGAYDNGSGTTLMRGLARALADVDTRRSIMFAWYNSEEEGLLASQRHAAALQAEGVDIAAVLGFDMTGIAYPVANPGPNACLCMFHGADDAAFVPLLEAVNFEFLELPNSLREVRVVGPNIRNSDESSFERRGYRTLRWAGMRTAGSYPAYHQPEDTMETIYSVAGGRSYFEQGIENTLRSAYYTALAIDTIDDLDTVSG